MAILPFVFPHHFLSLPMLIRTVRMTFDPVRLEEFRALFEEASPQIRAFPGCSMLELWEDTRFPNILSTFSHWESEEALASYRKSELFETTWARTKPLFTAPPEASSQHVIVAVSA